MFLYQSRKVFNRTLRAIAKSILTKNLENSNSNWNAQIRGSSFEESLIICPYIQLKYINMILYIQSDDSKI
jgi:hypothetical protein